MYEYTCLNCGKFRIVPESRGGRKFCCHKCYQEYMAKQRAKAAEARAKAWASDTGRLVDPKYCRKCAYGAGAGEHDTGYHCNYLAITGHTRTGLHPEGLTSTCHEFKQKTRRRPKSNIVIKT